MKKIKYPRYTRAQDLRCKLSENNIKRIKRLYEEGSSVNKISKIFKVSTGTIYYWLLPDSKRKERCKKQYLYFEDLSITNKGERQKKCYIRKYQSIPEFRKYLIQNATIRQLKHSK